MGKHLGRDRAALGDEPVEQSPRSLRVANQLLSDGEPCFVVGFIEKMRHHLLELLEIGWAVLRFADEHVDQHPQQDRTDLRIGPPPERHQLVEGIRKVVRDHQQPHRAARERPTGATPAFRQHRYAFARDGVPVWPSCRAFLNLSLLR